MNSYLIKNNNNILGIYINLDVALDYIYGSVNSNLIHKSSNVVIYEYKTNSCIILQEYNIDLNYEISKKSTINYHKLTETIFIKQSDIKYESDSSIASSQLTSKTSSVDTENTKEEEQRGKKEREFINEQNILGQNKINIVHDINLLKKEIKINEEKQNKYNCDLELYNKFKDLKSKNVSFVIPFMFKEKYDIFCILDNQNKISYDNFMEKYKPKKIKTQYDKLFEENISSEQANSIISEVFSNADDKDLCLATNQIN